MTLPYLELKQNLLQSAENHLHIELHYEEQEMQIDGVFIFIGLVPNTGFLADSGILLDKWGFVVTGHALLHQEKRPIGFEKRDPLLLETSIPGIFAAGDVRDKSTKQVVSAAGEGGSAALMIREYLKGI